MDQIKQFFRPIAEALRLTPKPEIRSRIILLGLDCGKTAYLYVVVFGHGDLEFCDFPVDLPI